MPSWRAFNSVWPMAVPDSEDCQKFIAFCFRLFLVSSKHRCSAGAENVAIPGTVFERNIHAILKPQPSTFDHQRMSHRRNEMQSWHSWPLPACVARPGGPFSSPSCGEAKPNLLNALLRDCTGHLGSTPCYCGARVLCADISS